jgi:hypothetical protein
MIKPIARPTTTTTMTRGYKDVLLNTFIVQFIVFALLLDSKPQKDFV